LIQFDKTVSFFKSCAEAVPVSHYLIEKELISLRVMIIEDQMAIVLNIPIEFFKKC
jgi:hypothetical protein